MSTERAAECVVAVVSACTGVVLSQTLTDTVKLRVGARRAGFPAPWHTVPARICVIGSAFKLPAEGSPGSGSPRVLDVAVTRERVNDVAAALRELIDRVPQHPVLLPVIDAGVEEGRPFYVTPPADGDSLDTALSLYGPAAMDDALPRLRALAGALDHANEHGYWHGALVPRDIIVSADSTRLMGIGVGQTLAALRVNVPVNTRYAAPEVLTGEVGTPAADQFALAVIAHEWMFGEGLPVIDRLVVPSVAGADVPAMQRAFDTATSDDPASRFPGCLSFVQALRPAAAVAPLISDDDMVAAVPQLPLHIVGEPVADLRLEDNPETSPVDSSALWDASGEVLSAETAPDPRRRFGAGALVAALVAGIAIGAFGMWLSTRDAAADAGVQEFTDAALASSSAETPAEVVDTPAVPPRDVPNRQAAVSESATSPAARRAARPAANNAAPASQAVAALLVRSVPSGATVVIDGVMRGTTPVAVRALDFGTRHVVVSRPGYGSVERQIPLTAERRSRTLEVELMPSVARPPVNAGASSGAASRVAPSRTPPPGQATSRGASSSGATAYRVGTLVIESRPSGAAVSIDGRPAGVTPLTLTGIAAGRRTVHLERTGYRTVTTTVDVRPGERARVAARLEGGLDEE